MNIKTRKSLGLKMRRTLYRLALKAIISRRHRVRRLGLIKAQVLPENIRPRIKNRPLDQ